MLWNRSVRLVRAGLLSAAVVGVVLAWSSGAFAGTVVYFHDFDGGSGSALPGVTATADGPQSSLDNPRVPLL